MKTNRDRRVGKGAHAEALPPGRSSISRRAHAFGAPPGKRGSDLNTWARRCGVPVAIPVVVIAPLPTLLRADEVIE